MYSEPTGGDRCQTTQPQFKTISLHFDEPSWNKLAASLLAGGDGWQALVSNPDFEFTQPESPTNQSQIDNPMTLEMFAKQWLCALMERRIAKYQAAISQQQIFRAVRSSLHIT